MELSPELRTQISEGGGGPWTSLADWKPSATAPGTASIKNADNPPGEPTDPENADWRSLKRHILVPWNEIRDMRWMDNRRLMGVAMIGLFPLLIIGLFVQNGMPTETVRYAFWATAFYFSAMWGVFFYYVFPAPGVTLKNCLICFFGTGLFSISLLQLFYYYVMEIWMHPLFEPYASWQHWLLASDGASRWGGWIVFVGLPEEVCKALALLYLARNNRPFQPQTMLFYGLMAGLGFGIYEGVKYQEYGNLGLSRNIGDYYILNMVRLTALPFIHAIWSGIAGYFIGFAYRFADRKRGLLIIAIALPSFLHGTYNAVSLTSVFSSLGVALISVFALNLYLAKSLDFERALGTKRTDA